MAEAEEALKKFFPGAVEIPELFSRVTAEISKKGFHPSKANVIPVLCRDDSITKEFYGELFKIGCQLAFSGHALAGVPTYGWTPFGAAYHHIPDDGIKIFISGPHIGIDTNGEFGKLNRQGIAQVSSSCGANCCLIGKWKNKEKIDPKDREFAELAKAMKPYKKRIMKSQNPLLELTEAEYQIILEKLTGLAAQRQQQEHHKFPIMITAGIHIDMPYGTGNRFQIRDIVYLENGQTTDSWNYQSAK